MNDDDFFTESHFSVKIEVNTPFGGGSITYTDDDDK